MIRLPTAALARIALAGALLALAAMLAAGGSMAGAASSTVVVTMNVPSAVSITPTLCPSGSADRTDMGVVQPGTTRVTGTPCQVSFGSSNDTSQLRMWQTDGLGNGMWLPAWGPLDTAIGGGDGIVSEVYSAGGNDYYLDSAMQPDGKLVAVGRQGSSANRMSIARYLPGGGRDTLGFGAPNGYVWLTANNSADFAGVVELLPDGSMLVSADTTNVGGNYDMTIIKLDSTGALVPGFGAGGRLVRSVHANNDYVDGICIDVASNRGYAVGDANADMAVLAFDLTTGADVAAFGPVRTFHIAAQDRIQGDCVVLPDGGVVVGGMTDYVGIGNAVVLKLLPDGTGDPAFDGTGAYNGVAVYNLDPAAGSAEAFWTTNVTPDGDILVSGFHDNGTTYDELVARIDGTTGALDTSFGGGDGWSATPLTPGTSSYGTDIEVLPDGRFYTTGGSPGVADAVVTRRRVDGSFDATFGGGDGIQTWDWPTSGVGADTRGASIGQDGELWVVGEDNDGDDEAVVSRLQSLPLTDYGAGANWGAGATFFGACLRSATGTGAAIAAPWAVNATCNQAVGAHWQPIARTTGTAGAKVLGLTTAGANDGVVQVQFGVRIPGSQRPGTYLAPITFEALAPDAP